MEITEFEMRKNVCGTFDLRVNGWLRERQGRGRLNEHAHRQ